MVICPAGAVSLRAKLSALDSIRFSGEDHWKAEFDKDAQRMETTLMDASHKNTVLLVEDSEEDILLLRRAFRKAGIANPLRVVKDGQEALNYLSGIGAYADRATYPIPSVMLIDLRLPRLSGFELLGWIRTKPDFNGLTVVVLTASDNPQDVHRAHELGVNTYLVKPGDFDELVGMMKTLRPRLLDLVPCL